MLQIDGRIQGPAGGDIAEELREYRYLQANRALPRARKVCFKKKNTSLFMLSLYELFYLFLK